MIPLNSFSLLIAQIIAHAGLIALLFFGNIYHFGISILVYFLTGCLGMTMTYHRLLSHKSWECPKFLEYFFSFLAGLGLTGSAISWVAIHKEHHAYADTPKDPHGTIYRGFLWCQFLSMFAEPKLKYVISLVKDPFYKFQHKYYFEIALVYAVILYLVDPFAVVYAFLAPAAILWNGGSFIVSISHRYGRSHNDTSLAFLVWGEGYHKTHHDFPKKSRFGKWDLGGKLIELIEKRFKTKSMV